MARAVGAIARGLGKVFDGLGSSLGFGYRETRECQLHFNRAPMAAPVSRLPFCPGCSAATCCPSAAPACFHPSPPRSEQGAVRAGVWRQAAGAGQ